MIEEIKTFRITCDKCKNERTIHAKSGLDAERMLQARTDWHVENAHHYCRDCMKAAQNKNMFRMIGMLRPKTIICETANGQRFYPYTDSISDSEFDSIFKYAIWEKGLMAIIRHDGFDSAGVPMNAAFLGLKG